LDGEIFLKLISFGDEHTVGKGCAPEVLAQLIGAEWESRGQKYNNNLSIHRQVTDFLAWKNYNQDDIILIGWTSPRRMDMTWQGSNFSYGVNKENYPSTTYKRLAKYDHVLFDPFLLAEQWVTTTFATQEMLKNHPVKYYMYNTLEKIDYNKYTEKTLKAIGARFYHNPLRLESSFYHYSLKHGFGPDNGLLPLEAHKKWAEFVSQKMRSVGVIEK
jgi:hypothetical protein